MALFGDKQKRSREPSTEPEDEREVGPVEAAFEREGGSKTGNSKGRRRTGVRAVPSSSEASKKTPGTLEKLAAIHGSRARLKRLSAEVLDVVLESFGVQQGALLIYDRHRQRLVLAADQGVAPSGKKCLARVHRDDPLCWDMPLHGLLNERAYLIEDPAENRYVPPLLEGGNRGLARVACVPIYRLRSPVGAFVLLTKKATRLTETEIRLSYVSLRYVAMIIDDARERDGITAITGSEDRRADSKRTEAPLVKLAEAAASGEAYSGMLHEIPAGLDPVSTNDTAPQEILLSEEMEAEESTPPPSEVGPANPEPVEGCDAGEKESRSEVVRLREELAGAVAELERRTADWADERDRAVGALCRELGEEHERTLAGLRGERDELATKVTSLSESLDSAQAKLREQGEEREQLAELESVSAERDELAAKVTSLSKSLESAQAKLREQGEEREQLAELESVSAERDELAAKVTSLSKSLGSAQAKLRGQGKERERLAELEGVGAERDELAAKIESLSESLESAQTKLQGQGEERERLAELEGVSAERDELAAKVASLSESLESTKAELRERAGERARLAELASELKTVREAADNAGGELEAAQHDVETYRCRIDELEADVGRLEAETAAAREAVAANIGREDSEGERLAARAAEIATLNGRIAATEAKVDASDRTIKELKTANAKLKTELTAAVEEHAKAGEYARSLETSIELSKAEAAELAAQLNAAQAKDEANGRAIETLKATTSRLEADRAKLAERGQCLEKEVRTLKEAVAAHDQTARELGAQIESAVGESKDAVERERLLQETFDRARSEWQTRETQWNAETDRLREEREELGARLAGAEASLLESSTALDARGAAEAAALEEMSRLKDSEAAARQEAERRGEEVQRLAGKISELDQVLERAATRSVEIEAREAAAQQEAEQLREETGKLSEKLSEFEQAVEGAAARSVEMEAREAVARQEAEQLREEAGKLSEKLSELEQAVGGAGARAAETEAREAAARQEAEQWSAKAGELSEKLSEFERVMEGAAARSVEIEAREAVARQEAEQVREEAGKLAEKVSGLEQAVQDATARSVEIEAREAVARQEAEQLREKAAELAEKANGLEQAAKDAAARSVEIEARETAARQEAEQLRTEADKLGKGVSALDHKVQAATTEAARWQKTAGELEQRIAEMEQQRGELEGERAAAEERVRELEQTLQTQEHGEGDLENTVTRLEAERRAGYADAARTREAIAESERRVQELQAQRDEQAQRVVILEAAVGRLEAEQAILWQQQREPAGAEDETKAKEPAGRSRGASKAKEEALENDAKTAEEQSTETTEANDQPSFENERFVVIEPSDGVGEVLAGRLGKNAQVVLATGSVAALVRQVEKARATVAAINLGSRGAAGGFNVLQALQQSEINPEMHLWAYVAPPQARKAIALGFIQWMPQPAESNDLVEWLMRLCGKGARVLSVGLEMEGLLNAREQLARNGISLSMAWDSKQGQELLEMVHPSSVVVNLDLARGDGYRTLGRLAVSKRRHTWVLCGGETPPAEAGSLVTTGAAQGSDARFLSLPDVGSALLEDLKHQMLAATADAASSGKGRQRPRERGTASGGRGRNAESGVRRSTALGSQRRMSNG